LVEGGTLAERALFVVFYTTGLVARPVWYTDEEYERELEFIDELVWDQVWDEIAREVALLEDGHQNYAQYRELELRDEQTDPDN